MKLKINKTIKKLKNKIKTYLKKLKLTEKKFNSLELCLIITMTTIVGILVGELIFSNGKIYSTSTSKLKELESVYNTLLNDYYNDLTEEKLQEAAINGMMSLLDDKYSSYYDTESAEELNEELDGTFIGIGAEITNDAGGTPLVVTVFENSPAEKSGLKEGDKILKLDDEDVSQMNISDLVKKIKGTTKKINLLIKRDEEEKIIEFTTGKVDIPSVTKEIFETENKKIGYLYIDIFALNTDEQFEEKLLELEKENIDSLIIDVRDNNGGHLDTVVNISSLFINKGDPICQIKTKEKTTIIKSTEKTDRNYPIVVLTNKVSASASELLAGALKEVYGATIVGTTTYGKGTVQKTKRLTTGAMIKYTAETWLTAKGNNIEGVGITPTIEVSLDENYYNNPTTENDTQLQKAIETLNK